MKAKRLLAAFLCAAMVLSSENFNMSIFAAELEDVTVADDTLTEEIAETDEETEEETDSVEETDDVEEAVEDENGDEAVTEDEDVITEELVEEADEATLEIIEEEVVGSSFYNHDFIESDVLTLLDGIESLQAEDVKKVKIPKCVKYIPKSEALFFNNKSVETIEFEDGSELIEIEPGAFAGSRISSITIPAGVTEIKAGTFNGAENLKSVNFENESALEVVRDNAFAGCTALVNVYLPETASEIETRAFYGCESLQIINMSGVEVVGSSAFEGCTSLTKITWNKSLDSIGDKAFKDNKSLYGIYMSNMTAFSTMGENVFEGCVALEEVNLPASLTIISKGLFKGCTALVNVALPERVEKVKVGAFENCSALRKVVFNNRYTESDSFVIEKNAFPEYKGITLKGYDGKVEEYADTYGYKFESFSEKYTIKVESAIAKKASFSVVQGNITEKPGQIVKVKITPLAGFAVANKGAGTIKLSGEKGTYSDTVSLDSFTDTDVTFKFAMPADNIIINANIVSVEEATAGAISCNIVDDSGTFRYDAENKTCVVSEAGHHASVIAKRASDRYEMGAWLLKYTSSDTKIATVDTNGLIRAIGVGTTTITVAVKATGAKTSFKLEVKDASEPGSINLSVIDKSSKKGIQSVETIGEEDFIVMEYTKNQLRDAAQTVTIGLSARSESGKAIDVKSAWESSNTAVATVASASTMLSSNVITIKKGTVGEAVVTATVAKTGTTKLTKKIIIRVIDTFPRVVESKVTVNVNSTDGAAVGLVPVYGYDIEKITSALYVNKNGNYNRIDYTYVHYDSETEKAYITIDNSELRLAENKELSFKDTNKLYFRVTIAKDGFSDDVYIPISEVVLVNKALAPTIKVAGKINLFFNSLALPAEKGSVTITQSLTKETVEAYRLVSKANYDKEAKKEFTITPEYVYEDEPDKLEANFDVGLDGVITRSDSEKLEKKDGVVVTNGYLYIWYKGYRNPVKKEISIPTENVQPKYALSATYATASAYMYGQAFVVQLIDSKTKKVVPLSDLDDEKGLKFDKINSVANFNDNIDIDYAKESNEIVIEVEDGEFPKAGKAVIVVQKIGWSDVLKYTFTLKTTTALPKAKLSSAKMILNNNNTEIGSEINVALDQSMIDLVDGDIIFSGNKSLKPEADKIGVTFENGTIKAALKGTVKKGNYSFKMTPSVGLDLGGVVNISPVTFTVSVVDDKPSIKLKSNKFAFNSKYPSVETITSAYTIANLPQGSSGIDLSDMDIKLAGTSTSLYAPYVEEQLIVDFDESNGIMSIGFKDDTIEMPSFSFNYDISGIKIADMPVATFRISVSGKPLNPVISTKAKGTINTLISTSKIEYTTTVKNLVGFKYGPGIDYEEYDAHGRERKGDEKSFDVMVSPAGLVTLTVKDGKVLDSKETYKIKLVYDIPGVSKSDSKTGVITVKPQQIMPKITVLTKAVTFFSGQKNGVQIVELKQTSEPDAKIIGVDWAASTSSAIKKAFEVDYNPTTMQVELKLVNPGLVKVDAKQTLNMVIVCDGQLENTVGTAFSFEATVRK